MLETDQSIREKLVSTQKENGPSALETLWLNSEMKKIDSANQITINRFIKSYGFPTKGEYGQKGVYAAFYVIQHAPLEMQLKHFNNVLEAGKKSDFKASSIALFEDRARSTLRNANHVQQSTRIRYHELVSSHH